MSTDVQEQHQAEVDVNQLVDDALHSDPAELERMLEGEAPEEPEHDDQDTDEESADEAQEEQQAEDEDQVANLREELARYKALAEERERLLTARQEPEQQDDAEEDQGDQDREDNQELSGRLDEILDEINEDYEGLGDEFKRIMEMNRTMSDKVAMLEDRLAKEDQRAQHNAHYQAIADKHPDANEVAGAEEFKAWLENGISNPVLRSAYQRVYREGSAEEVIAMLDDYKAAQQVAGNPPREEAAAAKKTAPQKTKARVPDSLGEVPGTPGAESLSDAFAQKSPAEQVDAALGMSPEKLEQLL